MKKIFILIIVYFSFFSICSSESNIIFSSSKNVYDINENIDLYIEINTSEIELYDLDLLGLDKFNLVSNNQSRKFFSINGKENSKLIYKLLYEAPGSGRYILGPVSVNSGSLKSQTIEIEVKGERILVNNSFPNKKSFSGSNNYNNQDFDDIDLGTSKSPVSKNKIIGVYGEEMKDIYPKRNYFAFLIYVIILFVLLIYLVVQIKYRLNLPKKSDSNLVFQLKKSDYISILIGIQKDFINDKKDVFYSNLNHVFRLFLDENISPNLSSKDYSEVKNTINNNEIITLYEKTYFPEYNKKEDSIEYRLNLIDEINTIFNKYK